MASAPVGTLGGASSSLVFVILQWTQLNSVFLGTLSVGFAL